MPQINRSSPGNWVRNEIDEHTTQAVIEAYTAAATGVIGMRSRAFDAALRAYRRRHPGVPEMMARRRVAQILCFAGADPTV
jgi:hypothetical protein